MMPNFGMKKGKLVIKNKVAGLINAAHSSTNYESFKNLPPATSASFK